MQADKTNGEVIITEILRDGRYYKHANIAKAVRLTVAAAAAAAAAAVEAIPAAAAAAIAAAAVAAVARLAANIRAANGSVHDCLCCTISAGTKL